MGDKIGFQNVNGSIKKNLNKILSMEQVSIDFVTTDY